MDTGIVVTRVDDSFALHLRSTDSPGDIGTVTTHMMDWKTADKLLTALGQHMLDWHFEKNPADMDERF